MGILSLSEYLTTVEKQKVSLNFKYGLDYIENALLNVYFQGNINIYHFLSCTYRAEIKINTPPHCRIAPKLSPLFLVETNGIAYFCRVKFKCQKKNVRRANAHNTTATG